MKLSAATLHREARRQGERAQSVRQQLDAPAATAAPTQLELSLKPYQTILELDAWNIRERDACGKSADVAGGGGRNRLALGVDGDGVWAGPAGPHGGGRPVIRQRGLVATRQRLDALREQLHAEALRRGLGQAAGARVIGDGAVWLWRLADDAGRRPASGWTTGTPSSTWRRWTGRVLARTARRCRRGWSC